MKAIASSVSAVLVIAVFAALAVVPQPSAASPPSAGSGSYVVTGAVVTGVRTAGGNTFVSETETVTATGTFVGTLVHDLVVIFRADGSLTFRGPGTFTGTVGGLSGTLEYTVEGQGSVVTGALHGSFAITRGTGDLAGVQGHVTIEGIAATGGTYTVQFQ